MASARCMFFLQLHHMKLHVCSLIWCETDSKNSGASAVSVSFLECNFSKLHNERQMSGTLWTSGWKGKTMGKWTLLIEGAIFFHLVIAFLENIYSASTPTVSSSQLLIWKLFIFFHWSVRSWAGATRSQYGPSPLRRSEPFQARESNT